MMSSKYNATYAGFMIVYKSFMFASWPLQDMLKHQLLHVLSHGKCNACVEGLVLPWRYFVQHNVDRTQVPSYGLTLTHSRCRHRQRLYIICFRRDLETCLTDWKDSSTVSGFSSRPKWWRVEFDQNIMRCVYGWRTVFINKASKFWHLS